MRENPTGSGLPYATYLLIAANILVFLLGVFVFNLDVLIDKFAFHQSKFLSGEISRAITSGFLHLDVGHLFWNLFFLWLFGRVVEEEYGGWWALVIYFTGMILGTLSTMLMFSDIWVLGASGAVFGLISASILLEPMRPTLGVKLLPLALVGVIYMIPSFLNMFNLTGQIANIAHVGGAIGGGGIVLSKDWERTREGLWILIAFVFLVLGLGYI